MNMNTKELKKWLKNKDFRAWRRMLLLLCETGDLMNSPEIAFILGMDRSSAHRTLKKLQIDRQVKLTITGNNRMNWSITNHGEKQVRDMQKRGLVPKRT